MSRQLKLTEALCRSAATDAGNRTMRAAGRTAWSPEDYDVAVREYQRLVRPPREVHTVIQTGCDVCGCDVEGVKPFRVRGDWRDRGNNQHGSDGHKHRVSAAEIRRQLAEG